MRSIIIRKILSFSMLGITATGLFAQYEPAVFDYQHSYFNNGQVLKAESNLMISGTIHSDINRVEILLFDSENINKPLYSNLWKRSYESNTNLFQIPFSYYLRGNQKYDFIIKYFVGVKPEEKEKLRQALYTVTDEYINQSCFVRRKRLYTRKPVKVIVNELNTMLEDGLNMYRTNYEGEFSTFSGLLLDYINNITDKSLNTKESESLILYKSDETGKIAAYLGVYEERIERLKQFIHHEIDGLLAPELLVCTDTRLVKEYKTEKVRGEIAINAGFGAITLDNNYTRPALGASPFVGVSVPLANGAFGSRFLGNSAISVGVLTNTFKDRNENIVKGPVFNRPIYVSYGYKVLKFFRINAGTAVVQVMSPNANASGVNTFSFRPFVGISAEINLSARMGNKK